jgi:hypothetical protein
VAAARGRYFSFGCRVFGWIKLEFDMEKIRSHFQAVDVGTRFIRVFRRDAPDVEVERAKRWYGGKSWRLRVGLLRRQEILNLKRISRESVDVHGTEQKYQSEGRILKGKTNGTGAKNSVEGLLPKAPNATPAIRGVSLPSTGLT